MATAATSVRLPPGPSVPPIDQISRFNFEPHEYLEECRERYGDIFTLHMLRLPPMVVVASPDLVRQVFDHPQIFVGGEGNKATSVHEGLGNYFLMALDGAEHRQLQQRLIRILENAKQQYMPQVKDLVLRRSGDWPVNEEFSLLHEMQLLALEIILSVILGPDREEARQRLVPQIHAMIGTALLDNQPNVISNLIGFFPNREIVYEIFDEEIAFRRKEGRRGRHDALSKLLEPDEPGLRELAPQQLKDQLLSMSVAGYDTTATTLAWVFHYLLQDKEAMDSVRGDIANIARESDPTPAFLTRQRNLNDVVNETARLHPISPIVNRLTSEEVELGGYLLPPGVMVCPSLYLLHRSSAFGENANDFVYNRKPSRYVNAFYPFGGGERSCIGQRFARPEMNLVLATILSRHELTLEQTTSGSKRRGFVVVPDSEVPVVCTRKTDPRQYQ